LLKRQSKHLALLIVLTLVASLFVGVGTASAKSINSVNKVVSVADDYIGWPGTVLTVKEDEDFVDHFYPGDTFEISIPSGVKWWNYDGTDDTDIDGIEEGASSNVTLEKVSNTVIEVTIDTAPSTGDPDVITIPLEFELDGATGDIAVTVDPLDSAVTGGDYTFARVADGDMTATVDKVRKISRNSSNQAGTIQLREASIGALAGDVYVTVKLPSNFDWVDSDPDFDVTFSGGFSGVTDDGWEVNGRDLTIWFTVDPSATQRGTIYIQNYINPQRDAAKGEVEVGITVDDEDGEAFDSDLVVAEYVDWGVSAKVDEVKDLVAGKFQQKTGKITVEENVAGTLLENRDLTVELPEWVKITDFDLVTETGVNVDAPDLGDYDQDYVDIPVVNGTETSTGKVAFKLELSMEGNKSGDITAKISGAGVEEQTLVIAKAIAPATATIDKVNEVKIGVQSQPIGEITIVEGKKGSISNPYKKNYTGTEVDGTTDRVLLTVTEGATFSATPTVTVSDGNVELSSANIKRSDDYTQVYIPIKSESTKISTIKVSNIKLTLNRAIPEGDLKIKVGGYAIVENSAKVNGDDSVDEGEFSTSNVVEIVAAKVITPADANAHAVAAFVIGNAVYKINGVDQAAMDQAPYIKGDRTYLPLRYVAYALGISDNNILWDGVNQTVTLIKNDKVVQVKIGSTQMLVNGAPVTMDAAPEVTAAGRTCLPIFFVAQAFGANVAWDAATSTVTITL